MTRRTVMHYADLGLLTPDQVTASGRALYGPYALRLLRDVMDLRALGVPLDEARDMVTLRRATHTLDGTYRRDWTRDDIPLGDERLRAVHARLRLLQDAYARQAEGLARFDRWLTKRFTGGDLPALDIGEGGEEEAAESGAPESAEKQG
ncbi:DNA-binding transcriptional MerR regulator [Deinococcus budaensis]|uniref:DNA-binding transcriptional MerR regulator n=1 Tax=Deinococcus budaensis TaxID=1665626 RepID=A0A7W8LPN0_9DEIO|nr:DNA-binding transcriptional MerR regulator [Deinococcus budaensis]